MKTIRSLFFFIAGLTLLASCQKVIDVDLNSASPKYVIEGEVHNLSEPCRIRVTKTKNFSENNDFEGVTNAFVLVSDNTGTMDTLHYTNNGFYESPSLTGVPGRTYYMSVKIGDETFTATSQMPQPVNFDTLFTVDFTGFIDTVKLLNVLYMDPGGVKNYYRYVLTLNGEQIENIYIGDDDLNNGLPVVRNIYYGRADNQFLAGDSVTLEMQCIDKAVHHYFFTLDQTISQSSAAPTNPVSNISGGALGYFSAHTKQRRSIVIQ